MSAKARRRAAAGLCLRWEARIVVFSTLVIAFQLSSLTNRDGLSAGLLSEACNVFVKICLFGDSLAKALTPQANALTALAIVAVVVEGRSRTLRGDALQPYVRPALSQGLALGCLALPWALAANALTRARAELALGAALPLVESRLSLWAALGGSLTIISCASPRRTNRAVRLGAAGALSGAAAFFAAQLQNASQPPLPAAAFGCRVALAAVGTALAHGALLRGLPLSFTVGEAALAAHALCRLAWDVASWPAAGLGGGAGGDPSHRDVDGVVRALVAAPLFIGPLAWAVMARCRAPGDVTRDGGNRASAPDAGGAGAAGSPAKDIVLGARFPLPSPGPGDRWAALGVAALAGLVLLVGLPLWLRVAGCLEGGHPLPWVLRFVGARRIRGALVAAWLAAIAAPLQALHSATAARAAPQILLRKAFHILALALFVPAAIADKEFLRLAYGVGFSALALLEVLRACRVWPLGALVGRFMGPFADERDAGLLILSHFSLLLGLATPLWLSSRGAGAPRLAPFAGLIAIGLGDAVASAVGVRHGRHPVIPGWHKTWEGTAAGAAATLGGAAGVLALLRGADALGIGAVGGAAWTAGGTGFSWARVISLVGAALASAVLEAVTTQVDNVFVPLHLYAALAVLGL